MLVRGATVACPACGNRRGLFRHWTKMAESCPRCGLVYGRIEGQWIGAIGINTIFSFGLLMIFTVSLVAATYPDGNTRVLVGLSVVFAVLVPILLFPFSRTFWTAVDLSMTPLRPDEVDWTAVDPDLAIVPEKTRRRGDSDDTDDDPPPAEPGVPT